MSLKVDTNEHKEPEVGTASESATLPPGWIEMIDESSGKPCYSNQSEGITMWEKALSPQVIKDEDEQTQHNQIENDEIVSKEMEHLSENQIF